MKQRPILFSAPMVKALLAGKKTQTRRVVKPSIVPHLEWQGGSSDDNSEFDFLGLMYDKWRDDNGKEMPAEWLAYCNEYPEEGVIPIGQGYGAVGDQLWVREAFSCIGNEDGFHVDASGNICELERAQRIYKASAVQKPDNYGLWTSPEGFDFDGRWTPSIFMPRWASRITLEITAIRIERLNEISESDAIAEGVPTHIYKEKMGYGTYFRPTKTAKDSFKQLWESINGADSWAENPWVWVVEFKVIEGGAA